MLVGVIVISVIVVMIGVLVLVSRLLVGAC
jgi:hypothetical protein